MRALAHILVGALFCILPTSHLARADVMIFNDFWPGYYSSPGVEAGHGVFGASANVGFSNEFDQAMPFTPTADYFLTRIDVAIGSMHGTNSAVLALRTDGGGVLGRVLDSWIITDIPSQYSYPVETVVADKDILLKAGAEYWLVASPGASDSALTFGSLLVLYRVRT
jgi:hypothetical protein